ncbi:MAG TPA: glycosyltransferase family 39 protein [Opitutus sp.]|nr:glycosyltransferase family 39 protein [Opitutus sp.]
MVHWLELGGGARWIRLAAIVLGVFALSLRVSWTQFHGATSETTLRQADVGRQLARGAGFTTLVNYPQVVAFLEARDVHFDPRRPYPELYEAPLYSIMVAGALRLLPEKTREALFRDAPVPPDGFAGDYFLLGLNLLLLWLAAVVTFDVARRLFDVRTAWLALLAVLLSVGVWRQTVAIDGAALLMLLATVAFWIWTRIEERRETGGGVAGSAAWLAGLGAVCGALFLTEYSAGALVLVALAYAAVSFEGKARWLATAGVTVGFAVVAGPWVARNVALTGNPAALAAQNVALKFADPTAEPATVRNTLSAALPEIDLNKLGNKTLTALQDDLKTRVWSGGAMWLAAFFVTGWLYTFRSASVNRLRWVFAAAFAVLLVAQAALNSGESERLAAGWLAPLMIVFGAGFFFVLLGSNATLGRWPRLCAAALLFAQALPMLHDVLEPRRLHFQYPPYYPGLFMGMRKELDRRDHVGRFGVMADVPAGVAWYGRQRTWSQPVKLHDFYAITLDQPIGELLLTPHTLDRPFLSELEAKAVEPSSLHTLTDRFGEWGRVYAGLLTGSFPREFPLNAPQKLAENLYVMLNPALPPAEK